jgi:hypothetical protein
VRQAGCRNRRVSPKSLTTVAFRSDARRPALQWTARPGTRIVADMQFRHVLRAAPLRHVSAPVRTRAHP